jgi:hypothetical protein
MQKRRRFKQTLPLKDRLSLWSKKVRKDADEMRTGPQRDDLLKHDWPIPPPTLTTGSIRRACSRPSGSRELCHRTSSRTTASGIRFSYRTATSTRERRQRPPRRLS